MKRSVCFQIFPREKAASSTARKSRTCGQSFWSLRWTIVRQVRLLIFLLAAV